MKFAPLCGGTRLAPLAPLLLPAALVAIPVVFQVVLVATGTSRQQAADAGWVLQPKVRRPRAAFKRGLKARSVPRGARFALPPAAFTATHREVSNVRHLRRVMSAWMQDHGKPL